MKLKEDPSNENQNGIAAALTENNQNEAGGFSLNPPQFNPTSTVIQRKEDNSEMMDWGTESYAYKPGAQHLSTINSWTEKSDLDAYFEINKISSTSLLYKLSDAIALVENPSKRTQKKLKSLKSLIHSRINTISTLKNQDASHEKLQGLDEKTIASNWVSATPANVHFKHIKGSSLLHNRKLTTKIREVREKNSDHNLGSTGYDLFIPFTILESNGWLPIILDPVLYIDVDVGKKELFKQLEDFKPHYEEYKKLIEENGGDKKKAFEAFAKKHTLRKVTTDLDLTQDATIFHEAGHVKEFQDDYENLMDNFLGSVKDSMAKFPDKESANKEFLRFAKQMWEGFSADYDKKSHTHIVKNELKAMIDLYEGKSEEEAFAEHSSFNDIKDRIHNK